MSSRVQDEFRKQAIAEVVVSAGAAVGRRLADKLGPDQHIAASVATSATGVVVGTQVDNDEANQAVHYFTATIAERLRNPR